MRNKKAKALSRVALHLWEQSDKRIPKRTIYKNMKKVYKQQKGEI